MEKTYDELLNELRAEQRNLNPPSGLEDVIRSLLLEMKKDLHQLRLDAEKLESLLRAKMDEEKINTIVFRAEQTKSLLDTPSNDQFYLLLAITDLGIQAHSHPDHPQPFNVNVYWDRTRGELLFQIVTGPILRG